MENIQVAVFGEALIDMISQEHGVFKSLVGGSPFNVCRAISRQNINCLYMSPIANDELGKQIAQMAKCEGIDAPFVGKSNKPTSLAIVTTDDNGLPAYTLYRDNIADFDISAEEVIKNIPDDLALFHTGSLVLVPEKRAFLLQIFEYLQTKNIPISIDINMRKLGTVDTDDYHQTVITLMKYANYLKVSDEDLAILGIESEQQNYCQSLAKTAGISVIALTKGEHGASLISQDFHIDGQGLTPSNFIDTVGAGDTFFASLLSYILRNKLQTQPLTVSSHTLFESALNYAQVGASINISREGCQPPNIDEIKTVASKLNIQI
ncbi:PfkB family carbohydrate kinase [Paraglaciecola aquimarina]|uniref:PfkB family carbohydrate kinase n=1 Tax=Paraglaciecola algarum TaxID=3050085 RepID=A0ABS9DB57_9ALTE|nr:PfkB family carbohydrate kinase [Paraglaciecola sp. G1-23]MCF2949605.1 PfkB family carbohydrate kinase [Paraglaciecola sp. G1-23]